MVAPGRTRRRSAGRDCRQCRYRPCLSLLGAQTGKTDIAFFLLDLDGGGAERSVLSVAREIAQRGYTVDVVVGDANSDYRSEVSADVNLIDFASRRPLRVFRRLLAYLHDTQPAVTMAALDVANIMLIGAAKLGRYRGRTVLSQRAVVVASQRELPPLRRVLVQCLQRLSFRRADAVISNSHAAALDLETLLRVPAERIVTIHNAVDADRVNRLAREAPGDAPPAERQQPLIVSVGSLTARKDMATLIKAFHLVKSRRPARLVIIGKGDERANLERLVAELGLDESVSLPGFDANPYNRMAAATVFVSSSSEEGFPNVIAEALALGRRIVATDCPGDTAALLGQGRWGRLVPVGDAPRMAEAIVAALDEEQPPDGRIRAADFSPASVASAYLNVLLPMNMSIKHSETPAR